LKSSVKLIIFFLCAFSSFCSLGQTDNHAMPMMAADVAAVDSIIKKRQERIDSNQVDLIDIVAGIFKNKIRQLDTAEIKSPRPHISALPAAGYTLATGVAGVVTANGVFYTSPDANISTVITSISYTVYDQIIFPLKSSIWTKGNKYNFTSDWRYLRYPSFTYGLGTCSSLSDGYMIYYSVIRLHQTLLRKVGPDIYAGLGYNTDIYWDIKELSAPAGKVTDFEKYGLHKTEYESGVTANFLYDTRTNPINPERGSLINVIYTPNLVAFGNNASWQSLVVDMRKYLRFPLHSGNVLALWSFDWLTLSGKPPYLMLPNTGGDPYSNPGRGYIQGRFRGANMVYVESEYRFGITNNGLLGGVVFANAESLTEQASGSFRKVAPACGAGIRLKVNKFSRTNLAIDYGVGIGGSRGLFVNLGELF
jgi:outer membrane protein assembly factor BamA